MAGGWLPRRGRRNTNGKKFNIRFFRFDTLRIATNKFSTLLGHGGYGSVYKGVLPDDGRTVAIKKFTKPYEGFLEMVELMSHLRHINLIQVIGCCTDNGQQLLVCEFAENGSVWELLHNEKAPGFNWETRAAVCLGTARGLSYLHHEISPRIIHRDIKPSNIVLDANFVPKIADFDLIHVVDKCVYAEGAKQTAERTEFVHLGVEYWSPYDTSYAKGTLGYLDPNYVANGELTDKVDVYSFGLVMLEIITGRRPVDLAQRGIDDRILLDWVTRVTKDATLLKIVDPKLTDFPKEAVERFINVSLLCTQTTPEQRPSMFEVVYMLYGRHKSDEEIFEMATRAIADRPARWSSSAFSIHSPVSMYSLSLTTRTEANDSKTSTETDYAAAMESREEPGDERAIVNSDSFIVSNRRDVSESKGECSSSEAALVPAETSLASSSKEDQGCPEDVVSAYFERSMEKIMRYHVATRRNKSDRTTIMTQTQTTVIKKSSGNMFKEAVYPPFLSGEFHRRPSRF